MAFDTKAFRASHRPWEFSVPVGRRTRTFIARHLSAPQCQKFDDMRVRAGNNARAQWRAIRYALRLGFPWRFSYMLRGDPVKIIERLEPAARNAAIHDFFEAVRGRNPINPPTPGKNSPAQTPLPKG